jgi:hypothetical protein
MAIPSPYFDHNLCFKYPNGSCEPILDIYVLKVLECCKECFNLMSLGPYNFPLKIRQSIGTPTPRVGTHLGVWRFIPTHFNIPRSMKCVSRASFLARMFASPCLGREPKVRVVTWVEILSLFFCHFQLWLHVQQIPLTLLLFFQQIFFLYIYYFSSKFFRLQHRSIF